MTETAFLDNYSPFDDDPLGQLPELEKDKKKPENYDSPVVSNGEEITQEMLDQMEKRLDLMEHDIELQESNQSTSADLGFFEPEPNWPKFYPIVHFDINEVDTAYRPYVNSAFFAWIVMAVTFLLNFIGTLLLLTTGTVFDSPGTKIAFSALYFFLVVPLALNLDAVSVYKAMKTAPSTLTYTKIFISLSLTFVFEFVLFLGFDDSGSLGIITTIKLFSKSFVGLGFFGIIITACMGISSFLTVKLFISLWRFFRGTEEGGNMQQNLKVSVAQFVVDTLH